jgi:hypothetical protein
MILAGKTRITKRKACPSATRPPKIPNGLTWAQTRASALTGWRQTAWAMARPIVVSNPGSCNESYWYGSRPKGRLRWHFSWFPQSLQVNSVTVHALEQVIITFLHFRRNWSLTIILLFQSAVLIKSRQTLVNIEKQAKYKISSTATSLVLFYVG